MKTIIMDLEMLRKGPKADVRGAFYVQYRKADGEFGGVEEISERRVVRCLGEDVAKALKVGMMESIDTEYARYTCKD